MKRLNQIVNNFIGSTVGVFAGHCIWRYLDYRRHPEMYVPLSAPWYTSILMYGAFAFVVLFICFVIKAVIRYKQKEM